MIKLKTYIRAKQLFRLLHLDTAKKTTDNDDGDDGDSNGDEQDRENANDQKIK